LTTGASSAFTTTFASRASPPSALRSMGIRMSSS
jgi:hypothetical protein